MQWNSSGCFFFGGGLTEELSYALKNVITMQHPIEKMLDTSLDYYYKSWVKYSRLVLKNYDTIHRKCQKILVIFYSTFVSCLKFSSVKKRQLTCFNVADNMYRSCLKTPIIFHCSMLFTPHTRNHELN